jgi:hypothetical protein
MKNTETTTVVKTTKLEQLYKLSKEALDLIKLPFEIAKVKKDLEREIITIEQEIAELHQKEEEATAARPFKLQTILDAQDDIELAERKLKQANKLLEKLF